MTVIKAALPLVKEMTAGIEIQGDTGGYGKK